MEQWSRLFKALSVVLPAGAVGASVLLALASTEAAASSDQHTNVAPPSGENVATRLQAIRSGISDLNGSASDPSRDAASAAPAWWGNGGWGRWGVGWGNGGWGNGGWHNGWHNFWHNW